MQRKRCADALRQLSIAERSILGRPFGGLQRQTRGCKPRGSACVVVLPLEGAPGDEVQRLEALRMGQNEWSGGLVSMRHDAVNVWFDRQQQ